MQGPRTVYLVLSSLLSPLVEFQDKGLPAFLLETEVLASLDFTFKVKRQCPQVTPPQGNGWDF